MRTRYFVMVAAGLLALGAGTVAYAAPSGPGPHGSSGSMELSGPCTATATIDQTGTVIDPKASNDLKAPIKGSASYSASISGVTAPRAEGGEVHVALPPGLPSVTIKSWADDKAKATSDSGDVSWDLPSALPRGITVKASGVQNDQGASCSGWMNVKLDGSITDSPAGPASLALTVVFLVGAAWAAIPKVK